MQRAAKIVCLILCLGCAAGALAQEKKITQKELPAPVLASFQKAYPRAAIKGLSTESEGGKTYFEIESVDGKVKRDLLYLGDGTVAEIEETVAAAELPQPVKAAANAKYPKGKITRAEKTTRDAAVSYELVLRVGKSNVEMSIDAAGKVLKESKSPVKSEGKETSEEKEEKD